MIEFLDINGERQSFNDKGSFNTAFNADCMELLRNCPNNTFDICVCDPPYGAGFTEGGGCKGWFTKYHQDTCSQSVNAEREREREDGPQYNRFGNPGSRFEKYKSTPCKRNAEMSEELSEDSGGREPKKIIAWDVAPGKEYFEELFRVSKHQIIWGGNYFELPPTRCFLIWKKLTISDKFTMAMCEYAWTSFNSNAKLFEFAPQGKASDQRFHPTQKPVELYKWIYGLYAKPGMKILDTHLGSGSSRIAAWDMGIDFVGTEIDPEYFRLEEERFKKHIQQPRLDTMIIQQAEQESLF